ncbi:SDR family oxidoreductase [Subtercola sp. Z020]|uniref:SDR family NAD(P)-dependent oxidoreductase n=1 Tax=Subtercola sp. Z020 TaxID=2080582 RepID=UPI000CE76A83|nr:SDR family oxidoreductase [Subtercola sp. Z020]PPF79287.1 SDR family oxidoreductase [Subtercola sp. Z020]
MTEPRAAAVITGAAGGIGRAIATAFAERGVAVVIADIRLDAAVAAAEQIAAETGAEAVGIAVDVTDSASVAELVSGALARFGRVDHLVNCAGMSLDGPSIEHTDEAWSKVVDLNLSGTFYVCRGFAPALIESHGTIVNISSIAAFSATRPEVHVGYDATKAAIAALTRTLAVEWAPQGVRVNAVAPGYTNTELLKDVGASNPETMDAWLSQTPQRRLMEPAEIAEVVLFLSLPASRAITAQTIIADGGYTAAK